MSENKKPEYDKFSKVLKAILKPEAKKRVDEDKKKRKHPKDAPASPASDDQT